MPTLHFQQLSSRRTNRISKTPNSMDQDLGLPSINAGFLTGSTEAGCHPKYPGTKCIPSICKDRMISLRLQTMIDDREPHTSAERAEINASRDEDG